MLFFFKKDFEESDIQGCKGKVIGTNVAQGAEVMSTGDTLIFIIENLLKMILNYNFFK